MEKTTSKIRISALQLTAEKISQSTHATPCLLPKAQWTFSFRLWWLGACTSFNKIPEYVLCNCRGYVEASK